MAHQLKINIYNFSLYHITETIQRQQRGRQITMYRHDNQASQFRDFGRSINAQVSRDSFLTVVFQALLSHFSNRFLLNADGTRAVSITDNPAPRLFATSYKIDGLFKGGETGIGMNVYQQRDALQSTMTIARTDVPAAFYYYKLWIPYDAEDGILMIQSYTDMGCTATFREQIEEFFVSYGYKPSWNSMIPRGFMEEYLNRSFISSIKVSYDVVPRENANGVFESMRLAKKESWLRNLSISFRDLLNLGNYKQQLEDRLVEFVDFNPERDTVRVFYTDENGRKANASIGEIENILPNIILPNELKRDGSDEPDLNSISEYTDGILESIKEVIGYTAAELE